jgi:hypothetical protein
LKISPEKINSITNIYTFATTEHPNSESRKIASNVLARRNRSRSPSSREHNKQLKAWQALMNAIEYSHIIEKSNEEWDALINAVPVFHLELRDPHRNVTLLILAVEKQLPYVANKLVLKGSDPNAKLDSVHSALWYAIYKKNEELIRSLLVSDSDKPLLTPTITESKALLKQRLPHLYDSIIKLIEPTVTGGRRTYKRRRPKKNRRSTFKYHRKS